MLYRKKMTQLVLNGLLAIALLVAPVANSAEIPETIKDVVRQRIDDGKTVGIVIGLVDADGASYFGYGKMAISGEQVPGKDTVFEIGSISKVFTGILLADAVRREEVNYSDTIETHLPKGTKVPTKNGKSITLENLSVQNSGLPRMPRNFRPKDPTNPYADYTVENMYSALARIKLKREVGEEYAYSNLGVGLLGHLLERASGESYEELAVNRIAKLVGMPDTGITLSPDMKKRLAKGHIGKREASNWDLPTFAGAGALRSTAQDMIAFLEANSGLKKTSLLETMRETHAPRAKAGSKFMQIGLGWHIMTADSGQKVIWHNGGTGGYRSFAGFVQDPPMGVVVLTNSTGAGDDDIGFHMLNNSIPLAGATKHTEVEVDRSILERYVGNYEMRPGAVIDVRLGAAGLTAKLTGQQRFSVYAESETKFFLKVVETQLSFVINEDGEVTHLVLHQGGINTEGKRIH